MTRAVLLALNAALILSAQDGAPDAAEIIRHSVDRDATNFERFKNYTFLERVEDRRYGRNGKLDSKEIHTYEFMVLGGRPYGKLMERDDQPLPAKEARKEQEKVDKEASRRQRESASDKAKDDKDRAEERSYLREVPEAFHLTVLGTDQIGGRPVWIMGAQPKSGYKPKLKRAAILTHLRGKIWVDQADYQWVKAEVEVIDPISFGLGLVKLASGSVLNFDQVRVNEEVWLPAHISVRAGARLFYLHSFREELDVTYRDYQKFQADSKIVE
ncbi:MAG TPA: hypothetical protein VGQ49_02900 [Bryobacteraceae bacterium]|nr:hypothetical protein [Bryobacteraceae bacterium]